MRDGNLLVGWGMATATYPEIAKVQVSRVVSAFDVGKIVNPKTVRSQGYSGVIMGITMALMEHTVYDSRDGSIVTSNLAAYAIAVNADMHSIEILFVDKPDPFIESDGLGARGVGEITVTGVAPAIAVYPATGRRIRDLPITPDKLLRPLCGGRLASSEVNGSAKPGGRV